MSEPFTIRDARREDVESIFALINELAAYERAPEEVVGSAALLDEALFGPTPVAEAFVVERDGVTIGFALIHGTFSTWECRPGVWLEDLYVQPEFRRLGVGEALLAHIARIAVHRGCTRLGWAALDWNTPALEFYEKLGAAVLDEWKLHRLSAARLAAVAGLEPPA